MYYVNFVHVLVLGWGFFERVYLGSHLKSDLGRKFTYYIESIQWNCYYDRKISLTQSLVFLNTGFLQQHHRSKKFLQSEFKLWIFYPTLEIWMENFFVSALLSSFIGTQISFPNLWKGMSHQEYFWQEKRVHRNCKEIASRKNYISFIFLVIQDN